MPEGPATVGRYHIERLIAHGGMGSLYLARDPVIDRLVAIKLLREGFDDAGARERFAREARSAGRLHHPNIVTVFDVGEHHDRPFIAMEYVAGETLAQLIKRRAIARLWQKLAILEDTCAALHYAHAAGIVHRDIKPANVMLDESGLVKILDFGIARAGEIDITRAGDLVGTLNYMSPEQLAGQGVDHRTDIYSVGVLAYELVTNQMAFPGTIQTGVLHQILNASPPPLATVVQGIDADIVAMIDRAMAKAPEDRYQDLENLRQDLVAVRSRLFETSSATEPADSEAETRFQSVASHTQPGSSPRVRTALPLSARDSAIRSALQGTQPSSRRGPIALGAALVALAVILGAIWMFNRPADDALVENERLTQPPSSSTEPPPVSPPASSAATPAAPPAEVERPTTEEELRTVRLTARQQIAAGDRQAALQTLSRGLALDARDAEINGMLDELARVARRAATDAGAAAAKRGQRTHAAFRDAQAREREADSLLRAGDRVPAIQALWVATARYSQVPEVVRQEAAPPASPVPASPAVITVDPPASVPASPPITTDPPPAPKPVPAPTEKPAAPPPAAPKPAVPKPEAPREPATAPDPNAAHVAAIQDTLRRYSQAYQSLESQAVARVMPSLTPDQLRNLERDFSNYRSYTVEIRNERIVMEDTTATVTCQVVRSFETRSGVNQSHTFESIFHLRRSGSAWTIERIESR